MTTKSKQPQIDLKGGIFDNFQNLIQVIDMLRDCGIEQDVKLPKIVVLGSQSSGKSSLLEQIVGLDFLPRGTGVVTRVPLIIRLQHCISKQNSETLPYAYFFNETKMYTNFNEEVKNRIESITAEKAGTNKGIVDDPITLTIVSATCPNLTLIDLPGMTKVPLAGSSQTHDIEKITKDLAQKYIEDEMSIILSVIPINTDMANSDALQMAHKFDPEGNRTFGVLTKVDIMDSGTNCLKALQNKEYVLKHGFVAVKCRSQKDIEDGKTVQQSLDQEKQFFRSHEIYSAVSELTGTQTLSNKLSILLQEHIQTNLPQIIKDIDSSIFLKQNKLKSLGDPIPQNENHKILLIVTKMQEINKLFNDIMSNQQLPNIQLPPLLSSIPNGGQKILLQYRQYYESMFALTNKIINEYTLDQIGKDLNLFAKPILGFLPFEAFQQKLSNCLNVYEKPSIELLKEVKKSLFNVLEFCIQYTTPSSGNLRNQIRILIHLQFKECKDKAKEMIKGLIECERMVPFESIDSSVLKLDRYKKTYVHLSQRTIYEDIYFTKFSDHTIYTITSRAKLLYQETLKQATLYIQSGFAVQKVQSVIPQSQQLLVGSSQPAQVIQGNASILAAPFVKQKEVEVGISKSKEDTLYYAFKFYNYIKKIEHQLGQQIPKIIQYFFIQSFTDKVHNSVCAHLKKNPSLTKEITENEDDIRQRELLSKSLSQLINAKNNLIKHRDKSIKLIAFETRSKGIVLDLDKVSSNI